MSERKCLGCGAFLQNEDVNGIGYTPKTEGNYCQRCFKMIHYDAHKENDFMPNNDLVLSQLNSLDGNFVWIMDIFDFDTSLNSVLPMFYASKPCHIVLNKCDLLPEKINYEKLGQYVLKRIKKLDVKAIAVLTRGVNNDFIENFDEYINTDERPVIMSGLANVGKSTIINHLLKSNVVTTNRYPATTISVNEITSGNYHIVDTVGVIPVGSVQLYLTNKDLKTVVPVKRIRPSVYQIHSNQSISLGGIARIDITDCSDANVVVYVSNTLKQTRNKYDNADKFWSNEFGKELTPVLKGCNGIEEMKKRTYNHEGKKDYFISGLGFVTINSRKAKVTVCVDKRVNVTVREAMI